MDMIDYMLMILYGMAIACALYILYSHKSYFYERFQKGVVSLFMLAMLFFLLAYTFKMLVVLFILVADAAHLSSPELLAGLRYAWTLAQLGTTVGLVVLALLTRSGNYDQFMHIKKFDRKGERHADSDPAKK
ncbi:hypothetical protein [Paenibacillus donghaensis]|nr:hypothetical protein [Paenibacillus donghaensis]